MFSTFIIRITSSMATYKVFLSGTRKRKKKMCTLKVKFPRFVYRLLLSTYRIYKEEPCWNRAVDVSLHPLLPSSTNILISPFGCALASCLLSFASLHLKERERGETNRFSRSISLLFFNKQTNPIVSVKSTDAPL